MELMDFPYLLLWGYYCSYMTDTQLMSNHTLILCVCVHAMTSYLRGVIVLGVGGTDREIEFLAL